MGTRGPKPLPNNVHALNGNPSKKNLGSFSCSDIPVEIPDAPEHLDDKAKEEWARISKELYRVGLIAKIDRAMLGVYCIAYSRAVYAEKKIQEDKDGNLIQSSGSGYQQIGPWLQIYNRAVEQMKSAAAEFGMTPSARVRVNPAPQMDMFGNNGSDEKPKASGKKTATPASYFPS